MFLRRVFASLISKIIMPAQRLYPATPPDQINEPSSSLKFVKSTGDAQVGVYRISGTENKITPDSKIMLLAFGNGDCAENHLCDLTGVGENTIIEAMNFRNVGKSQGSVSSENDWVDDAIAVINHYRDLGVPLKNILLNGHSLGGAILTMAAAKVYKEELAALEKTKEIITDDDKNKCSPRLINNRSFSTLADEIMISLLRGFGTGLLSGIIYGWIATLFVATSTAWIIAGSLLACGLIYPQIPEFFLRPILNTVLWLTFGRMDAFSAYQALPNEAKDYIIAKDDGVIRERATIHYRLKGERKIQKQELRQRISNTNQMSELIFSQIKLLNIKDSKLRFSSDNSLSMEAHNCPVSYLKTYHKLRNATTAERPIRGDQVMERKCTRLLKI